MSSEPDETTIERAWHGAAWLVTAAGHADYVGEALQNMRETGEQGMDYALLVARRALDELEKQ